jgi:hypothetical protein
LWQGEEHTQGSLPMATQGIYQLSQDFYYFH